MKKIDLFIDIDETIWNTTKAIVELYDEDYKYYSDYKQIPWGKVVSWEFTELKAAKPEHINNYFNQKRFFDRVEFYPYAVTGIKRLSKFYNINFVSHGYSPNLRAKAVKLKQVFGDIDYNFIGVNLKNTDNKSEVDMSNGIFIDDRIKNLESSNAFVKILFGEYEWNTVQGSSKFFRETSWHKLTEYLILSLTAIEETKNDNIRKSNSNTNKVTHKNVCDMLNDTYNKKNKDYGDSFSKSYDKFGLISCVVRIGDKYNRLANLSKSNEIKVKDESISDTLLDMANYCILTYMEIVNKNNKDGKQE